ncbi:Crp/Fnr family transcriptional regulator [Marinobacterium arenosum]|uniref:Crp/Fnr family transcriptional regulator n=1 Tax=Marinobacterium arenosum TaxID=2862496 RepID=UPI001C97D78D|nr:Crp/Fnr family transcriptional regulator [Marinobacterium arenosum]MBY4675329.1 Crp/Fnr family transcriptional regulator [Marinobacterium arenosum]
MNGRSDVSLQAQLEFLHQALAAVVPLSGSAWQAAEPLFSRCRFEADEHLLSAGRPVDQLLFLTSGLARYYYLNRDGREFNKSFCGPGQVASSVLSLVTGEPAPFHIQALAPAECLSLRYTDFLMLADSQADWNRLYRRMLELLVIKKERREADFLLLSAEQRYQKFLAEFGQLAGQIPNYHIASYLGITEVALSRIRRRMGLTRVNEAGAR